MTTARGRTPHELGPLVLYHGCDREVGEKVLAGREDLRPSCNEYDWLGSGVYFWVASATRAFDWAAGLAKGKERSINEPFVIGAFVFPRHCLNLTDHGALPEVRAAYERLAGIASVAEWPLPRNTAPWNGIPMRRALDCAVINTARQIRTESGGAPYDTVYGVFEEGGEIYPGAAFKWKTHVQVAVINMDCVVGYFRVPKMEEIAPLRPAA